MKNEIKEEYEKAIEKRDEIKGIIEQLEAEDPQDKYNIRINRDRLAYWEGKTEGLKFALDRL
ncbi:MAG: hypothetical protein ABFR82_12060 [Nitrospirota bacterium]